MRSPTKQSQPRKGRHHKARRVNAGDDGPDRKNPSPARGDIIKPGVSTPGANRCTPNHPSPVRGDTTNHGVQTLEESPNGFHLTNLLYGIVFNIKAREPLNCPASC